MSRPISQPQFAALWRAEFLRIDIERCILCGNHGLIDTRGKVFDPTGRECGGVANCICPNGRVLQRMEEADARREAQA